MPVFYFNLASPNGVERDDCGLAFDGLDAAYLDACKAALEISLDMLRARQDPGLYRFEVLDSSGKLVLDIPFAEVVEPGRKVSRPATPDILRERLQENLRRSHLLKTELALEITRAHLTIESARAILVRTHA